MPRDIEELLRESLQARAQDVEPNPETWKRVQARIRRQRTFRLALAGVSAAAAVLVAIVVLPGLIDRPDVVFPGPAAPTDPDAPGPPDCSRPAGMAAVYTSGDQVWVSCVAGGERLLYEDAPTELNPALAPDGSAVVFESWRDESPFLVHLDLATGAEQVIGGGELPAFAADGWIAYVQEGGFIVGGELFAEPEFEIAAQGRVARLAWDTVDEHLLYETDEGEVWIARPDDHEQTRIEPHDERYYSPAVAPDGTIAVLSDSGSRLEIGVLDRGVLFGDEPEFTFLTELGDVGADHVLVPAGYVTRRDGRWVGADRPSWLVVVDGTLTLVDADGRKHWIADGVQSVAVNPAAEVEQVDPGEPFQLEPQLSLPHNVEVTRQRVYAAATAGDFGGLHALMDPEFSWSFGGNLDRDEAIDHLSADPELLDVIAGLLELPYGVVDAVEPELFVWPWLFTDPEANWPEFRDRLVAAVGEQQVADYEEHGEYLGWRVGIDRDGVWRYFVAGD